MASKNQKACSLGKEKKLMRNVSGAFAKPFINVTPLIDVLLVMLIIFMVAAPLKPHSFAAKLPSIPEDNMRLIANIDTLVVTVLPDRTLRLNGLSEEMGTVDDPSRVATTLSALFKARTKNRAFREEMIARTDMPDSMRIQKTVFVKAPRSIPYGDVARVIDGLKGAGAEPIGLQLDGLN
jgi:biopolymer transport protein ExbD